MSEHHKPFNKHYHSAKEHLAGVRAAAAWHQELIDRHLLDSQNPIKDQPVQPPDEGKA